MIWLDTPESNSTRFWYIECFWKEAKEHLKKLIKYWKYFFIEYDKTQWYKDKYWRTLWYLIEWIILKNWKLKLINLNWKQIKDWYW